MDDGYAKGAKDVIKIESHSNSESHSIFITVLTHLLEPSIPDQTSSPSSSGLTSLRRVAHILKLHVQIFCFRFSHVKDWRRRIQYRALYEYASCHLLGSFGTGGPFVTNIMGQHHHSLYLSINPSILQNCCKHECPSPMQLIIVKENRFECRQG